MKIKKTAALLCLLMLAGCAGDPPTVQISETATVTTAAETVTETEATVSLTVTDFSGTFSEAPETSAETAAETEAEPAAEPEPVRFDTGSDVIDYLSMGEWYVTDMRTGDDYARLRVWEDGSIMVERIEGGNVAKGKLDIPDREGGGAPYNFGIVPDGIADWALPEGESVPADGGMMHGYFLTGNGLGEDMLFLRDMNNGTMSVLDYAFSPPDHVPPLYRSDHTDFLMHRKTLAAETPAEKVSDGEFYAWCWERTESGLLLEPVELHENETVNEVTDRKYLAAEIYAPEVPMLIEYPVSDRAMNENYLSGRYLGRKYPLMLFRVFTDENGVVRKMEELDNTYGFRYDLGGILPEFSCTADSFTVGGKTYGLADIAQVANSFTECTACGSRIIIEGHSNPHNSEYIIYNTDTCEFEEPMFGACLSWVDDDINTCIYAMWESLYDRGGNVIATAGGEIMGIDYAEDGKSAVLTWYEDEEEKTMTVEIPAVDDRAVYAYMDFLRSGTAAAWQRFVKYAPENAVMYIITSPPDELLRYAGEIERGDGSENIMAISLADNACVRLNSGTYNFDDPSGARWQDVARGEDHWLNKGGSIVFETVIPEGIPSQFIELTTPEYSVGWDVAVISGKDPICSEFAVQTGNPQLN